jgi:ABC-type transport system involved in cytochrome bd biosynthesis fused ATPase/permease subunit
MVAGSLLVLTTGRQYCERFTATLPVACCPAPVPFPRMMYYQLWHERTHASPAALAAPVQVKQVASAPYTLPPHDNGHDDSTATHRHHQALPRRGGQQRVSLTVEAGEVHAVLGENGAGKSTLMKIIYGSVKPDDGAVMFNGAPVHISNPQEARALGISMVFQHFSLFDTLTVAENVWLGLDKSLSLPR